MNFDELFGHLGQHTVDGLAKGSIYALVALGYTLVYGVLKLINFAHSEVFMIGTFAVLGTWTALGATSSVCIHAVTRAVPSRACSTRARRTGRTRSGCTA